MITEEQYKEAKNLIKQYESEQLDLLRTMRSKSATTTIPQERWGVHRTHCCVDHGCKYNYKDCPVELGLLKQDYPCEMCNDEDDF